MKSFSNFRAVALLALAMEFFSMHAGAQTISLAASVPTNSVVVSNSLTYTILVTNTSVALENIIVTNVFSAPVQFISYSPPSIAATNTTTNIAVLYYGALDIGLTAQMTLTVQPQTTGTLTNSIFAYAAAGITNGTATTNLAVSVINTNVANLALTLTGFPLAIYSNDWVNYQVIVTNTGPAAATGAILTNILPTNGWELISASPTNSSASSNNLIFALGALPVGGSANFQFTVQPTNTGAFTFSASINSDNGTNEFISTNVVVTNFFAANLVASGGSAQTYNRWLGREQQTITLSNAGPDTIPAARVIVSGLSNQLDNAVGTNNGNPYVVYGAPLTNSQSVNLTMLYFPDYTNFPFSDSQLHPVAIAAPDLSMPLATITSTNLSMVLITNVGPGYWLLRFKALTNHTYTIAYSDGMSSTNWLAAQPPVWTSANYVFWIDYGPPETVSNSPSRLYRVYLNP